MKKILIAIFITITTATSALGAVSEDMSVYVRKDVYEAHQQSINSKLDMILEQMREFKDELKEQKKDITELSRAVSVLSTRVDGNTSSLSARIDGLDKRMDNLDKRIDDLRNGIYLWLVAIGLVIAWPKLFDKFKNIRKSTPAVTLEDVMRLIEENNVKLNGRTQA